MTNYSYNTSIDSQTYNSIKLVRPEQGRPASPMFLSERIRTPLPAGACCSSIKRWTKRPQTHRSRSRQRSVWSITSRSAATQIHLAVSIACGRDSFFWSISMILTATRSASMSCWKRSLIRGKTICTPWNWKQKLCGGREIFLDIVEALLQLNRVAGDVDQPTDLQIGTVVKAPAR